MSNPPSPNPAPSNNDDDLEGIEGWLIVPVINLVLVIGFSVYVVFKNAFGGSGVLTFSTLLYVVMGSYASLRLVLLFQKKRMAGYLMMGLYGLALCFDIYLLSAGISTVALFIRIALALALLLYIAFSKRVEQTLVN